MKKLYTILKNCHFSNFIPKLFLNKNREITFSSTIAFNDSCEYMISERSCVNKLFGFTFGIFNIHKYSARFGWSYNKDLNRFYIYKYVYNDGKLTKQVVFKTDKNVENTYKILVNINNDSTTVSFIINNDCVGE